MHKREDMENKFSLRQKIFTGQLKLKNKHWIFATSIANKCSFDLLDMVNLVQSLN